MLCPVVDWEYLFITSCLNAYTRDPTMAEQNLAVKSKLEGEKYSKSDL